MKTFICGSCGGEWYSDESQAGSVRCCPYCMTMIPRPLEPETVDTLGKAIYSAISALDLDILSQAARMKGYLMDTVCDMPELKKEIRLFFKFFNQDYLSRYKEAFLGDMAAAATVLSRIEYYLVEDEALDKGRARQMTESCMEAIRYYKGISETVEESYFPEKPYYERTDTENDYDKAIEYFQKAADLRDTEVLNDLALCYCFGRIAKYDRQKSAEYFLKAADQGDARAQNNLGICYRDGTGVAKDHVKAAEWFQKAADQGFGNAQHNLGLCYRDGTGVPRDPAKAVQWFQKAAVQGLGYAQYSLGFCYQNGLGVPKDPAKAVIWFQKAVDWFQKGANQGFDLAQYGLGLCYENGLGVPKDPIEAAQWFQKAAYQGFDLAQYGLGLCYENGLGVPKDSTEAAQWFQKAAGGFEKMAEQGNRNAGTLLEECHKRTK